MTTVKWMHSDMPGAPVLSGTAGTMIAVLDACLVNGWGSAVVDSLVVASGVATVTKSGHPFSPQQVTEISGSGSTGGTLNGQHKVLTTTSTTYTFDATGIPDQGATGVISHKVAALGWAKPFADIGSVAAYRLDSVSGTGSYLQVTDSGTAEARVVGYLSMSDAVTGTDRFPTEIQQPGGAYINKSYEVGASSRPWALIGDDRGFYISTSPYGPTPELSRRGSYFGDLISLKPVDPYRAILCAGKSAISLTGSSGIYDVAYSSAGAADAWFCRGVSGVGGSTPVVRIATSPTSLNSRASGALATPNITFPNPADNGLYLSRLLLSQTNQFRGWMPGAYASPQDLITGSPFQMFSIFDAVDILPGRKIMAMLSGSDSVWFVDVTGPWR